MLSSHYNNFNLLRLFAALQVVCSHSVKHLDIANEYLLMIRDIMAYFPGVPVFFLISGYLITMSYDKNSNIIEYIKNRVLRIMPGLYVSFFIGLFILYFFGQFRGVQLTEVLIWSVAQLTLFQFYNPTFIRDFGVGVINGSLWTISVELVFYIILPFIYIFFKKNFRKRFLGLMALSFIFYFYILNISTKTLLFEKIIEVSILPYLFYFLFGLLVYKYQEIFMKYIANKVLIYGFLYGLVVYLNNDSFIYFIFKQFIFALFIFSFIFSYKSLSYKLMGHNDFTYGIYIYHMLIVNVFVEVGYMHDWDHFLMVLVLSILFGVLSYQLVEKPFLKLKKKSLYNEIIK